MKPAGVRPRLGRVAAWRAAHSTQRPSSMTKLRFRFMAGMLSLALGALFIVHARTYGASPRIGFLSPGTPERAASVLAGLRQGLRERGYIDGTNITIEARFANDQFDRLPDLARKLIGLPVDVLVTFVTAASIAAKDNTNSIPIVMIGVGDPVASKLVSSLPRPGGNVTGTSGMFAEAAGKRLQLLKEAAPAIRRVAVIWNPTNRVFQLQMIQETEAAAIQLGIRLQMFEARDLASIERVFATIGNERALGVDVLPDTTLGAYGPEIAALAQKARLPSIGGGAAYAEAGGLIGYGPSMRELARDAGGYISKILSGAKAADLPVQQPRIFELVINMNAARQIGVTVPQSLKARADTLIQ